MSGRIERRFAALAEQGRGGLVTFLSAGDPDYDHGLEILRGLPAAGVDIIEIGMPFTDPMADGPSIQAAGLRALAGGQTMIKTLAMARAFREDDAETPLVLMGYYNPIHAYGKEAFLGDAYDAGVDGLIIVDLPPEEDEQLCLPALAKGLNFISLATPTTDDARLPAVLANTSGFVYYVAITGITGARGAAAETIAVAVSRIKSQTDLPVAVGPSRASSPRPTCRSPSASASARPRMRRRRPGSPMRQWSEPPWSSGWRQTSMSAARRGPAWSRTCSAWCAIWPGACAMRATIRGNEP